MAYKILVVDDDFDLVLPIKITLEAEGYEVSTAGNGSEARKCIEASKPDLILLDVMMTTETEGFDLAWELQENAETRDIPIVMLTAMSQSENYIETFQHISERPWPVSVFLEKPTPAKKLLETVRKILK
ncbi:MAG: response regulator [Acidobacteria bacterium]|nr:response regulator [Acidobacteriota bacterium]